VSELKAGQIAQWRSEMTARAESVSKSPFFNQSAAELLQTLDDANLKASLAAELNESLKTFSFQNIRLVDTNGESLINLTNTSAVLSESTISNLSVALISRQTIWSGFYFSTINNSPQIDIIAPRLTKQNGSKSATALRG
jgi:hypothetical protein